MRAGILFAGVLAGCYQENLPQIDIPGTLVVPRAAATRTVPVFDDAGVLSGTEEVTDVRLLGPVYLGAFSGMDFDSFAFPHPSMGPVIGGDAGDTFPYGATTVGRFDYACVQELSCRVTTGRFTDYADLLSYFNDILGTPVVDQHGLPIGSADELQQICYDYFNITSDSELSFLGATDFVENADGDFEAPFLMPHTTYLEGMALWGFMDAPTVDPVSPANNGTFSSCNPSIGRQYVEYDQEYYEGAPYTDLLNVPSEYLRVGDWVADGLTVMTSAEDEPTIHLSVSLAE